MSDKRKTHLDAWAVSLLVTCSALWGVAQVAAKVGLTEMAPLLQAALRSAGAALLLLLWSHWRGLKLLRADGTAGAGILAGALFAAEFACIFIGLQFTTASRMAVFLYMAPFVVAIGMPLMAKEVSRGEGLHWQQVCGLLLAFGGVVWAFAESFTAQHAGPRQWWGDSLGLCAAVLWGLTTLTLRGSRLATALPEKTLLYQLVVSGAALALASWQQGERWSLQLSPLVWGTLLFQTVIITFASYLTWFWLVRHYPATRISAFTLLTPIFGLLAGVLLLNEPLTLRLMTALLAVCLGIWWVSRPAPEKTPT